MLKLALFVVQTLIVFCPSMLPGADPGWTGIRAYMSDAKGSWEGTTWCEPCRLFCAEIRESNRQRRSAGRDTWRCGYTEVGDNGQPNDIQIVSRTGGPIPRFVPVIDGVELNDRAIVGYDAANPGRLNQVLNLKVYFRPGQQPGETATLADAEPTIDPLRRATIPAAPEPPRTLPDTEGGTSPFVPSGTTRTYRSIRGSAMENHLVEAHGFSREYVATLSDEQLERLHTDDCKAKVARWVGSGMLKESGRNVTVRDQRTGEVFYSGPSYVPTERYMRQYAPQFSVDDPIPDRSRLDALLKRVEVETVAAREKADGVRDRTPIGLAGTERVSLIYNPANDAVAERIAKVIEEMLPEDFGDTIKVSIREKPGNADAEFHVWGGDLMHYLRVWGPKDDLENATKRAVRIALKRLGYKVRETQAAAHFQESSETLRMHLVQQHGYQWGQVASMSPRQLQDAHNVAHGIPPMGQQMGFSAGFSSTYAPRPANYAGCAPHPTYGYSTMATLTSSYVQSSGCGCGRPGCRCAPRGPSQPIAPPPGGGSDFFVPSQRVYSYSAPAAYYAPPVAYSSPPVVYQQPVVYAAPYAAPRAYASGGASYSSGVNIGGLQIGVYGSRSYGGSAGFAAPAYAPRRCVNGVCY